MFHVFDSGAAPSEWCGSRGSQLFLQSRPAPFQLISVPRASLPQDASQWRNQGRPLQIRWPSWVLDSHYFSSFSVTAAEKNLSVQFISDSTEICLHQWFFMFRHWVVSKGLIKESVRVQCMCVCTCEGSAERKMIVQRLQLRGPFLRTPNLSDVNDWLCVRRTVAAQRRYRGVWVHVCVIRGWRKQSSGAEVKE